MADVTQIAANGINYNIKDEAANDDIAAASVDITTLEGRMTAAEGNISALQTAVNGMFEQNYDTVTAGGTLYLPVQNYEVGFVVTSGAATSARGLFIFYCNGQKTVSVTKVLDATGVELTVSDNQIAIKNNTSAYLFIMQFKR